MTMISILIGVLVALSVYLLLSPQFNRWLYGLILFSSVININLLLSGRVYFSTPTFRPQSVNSHLANPLPQAMVLTAIVIAFALIAFSLILLRVLYMQKHGLKDKPFALLKKSKKRKRYG